MDAVKIIVAHCSKRGWSGMEEGFSECTGGCGGGTCGEARLDGAIVRGKLYSLGDTFGAGSLNISQYWLSETILKSYDNKIYIIKAEAQIIIEPFILVH